MHTKLEITRVGRAFAVTIGGLAAVLILAVLSMAAVQPSHLDKTKNPSGCAGCHKGHGQKGTPMLNSSVQDICFSCHGLAGQGRGIFTRSDISSVFGKRYRHPVAETSMYHVQGETLPERSPGMPRHVACEDCHSVHMTESGSPMKGVFGHKRGRKVEKEAVEEYEVCYKCHADSMNLPAGSKDVSLEFEPTNSSFHPVEAAGKNIRVPSLTGKLDVSSRIVCSDCHGNDDPAGPKGPHGSNLEHMLTDQYTRTETAEGPAAYALCYKCHNRQSILGNQSFQRHKEHIVYLHTPCSACHNPHGVVRDPNLIDFDRTFVASSPMATYVPGVDGKPVCLLSCHIGGKDVLHDNAFYSSKIWP
ncbi:MAG: hypothetical protein M0Z71_01330 [Nitrospiraceae bacterium]|nr:hypothetical protein [Nitrospiraceae bacterium]